MSFKFLSAGFLTLSALLPFMPSVTQPASAMCPVIDVNTQIAIHGTQNSGYQGNRVGVQDNGACFGAASTNVGTQVYTGPGDYVQDRNSNHVVGGDPNALPPGMDGGVMYMPFNMQMDMATPAYDQGFPLYGNDPAANPYSGYGSGYGY